jgi:hypothetical protein
MTIALTLQSGSDSGATRSTQASLFSSLLETSFNGEPRHNRIDDETTNRSPFSFRGEPYALRFLACAVDEERCPTRWRFFLRHNSK